MRGWLGDALPVQRRSAIVAGCEAHVWVLQTAMGLLEHGYKVTLVTDAIGSRTESNYNAAVRRLVQARRLRLSR